VPGAVSREAKIKGLKMDLKKKPLFAEWNKINYNYYYNTV